jgi:hypothetical protein
MEYKLTINTKLSLDGVSYIIFLGKIHSLGMTSLKTAVRIPKEYLASYSYYYYWLSSIHVYEAQMSEMIPPMVISLVPCHPLDFLISE